MLETRHSQGAQLYALMMPLRERRLLLPNVWVAEVVGYSDPEPLADAPAWLAGQFPWRGVQVPLLHMEALLDPGREPPARGRRVAVLYAPGTTLPVPFIAIVLQAIPSLLRLGEEDFTDGQEGHPNPSGAILRRIHVYGQAALVPDLDALERLLEPYAQSGTPAKEETDAVE